MMTQDFFKNKTRLAWLGVLVLNLAVLVLGSWFLTSKIADLSAELKEKKSAIATSYLNWQRLEQGKKELLAMEDDFKKINGAFISLEAPYDFINSLEELAKSTALSYEINLVTLGEQGQKKEKTVTFQVEHISSFNNLMHFLKYLENMEYYTKVESLQIDKIGEGQAPANADLKNLPAGSVRGIITLQAFVE